MAGSFGSVTQREQGEKFYKRKGLTLIIDAHIIGRCVFAMHYDTKTQNTNCFVQIRR